MDKFILIVIVLFVLYLVYMNQGNNSLINKNNSKDSKSRNFIDILNKISSADKVRLTNIKEKWSIQKNVIDENLNNQIVSILKKLLHNIHQLSGVELFVKSIENAYIIKDKDGNLRCIADTFVYDVKNYHTVKMIFDFVIFDGVIYINIIDIDETSLNNILNRYDIRWKSQGILSRYNMFDENVYKLLDNHYSQHYTILPLKKGDYNIDTTGTFTLDQLSHMYLPSDIPSVSSPYFCNKEKFAWDSKSIPISTDENCMFNNPPDTYYPKQPYDAPGVVIHSDDVNNFSWLRNNFISNSL
jgi:hypothetical protein